jgi:PH domain
MENNSENFEVILKEGWVDKRSRFIKEWRKRWMVLTPRFLFSFKNQQGYKTSPTERLRLQECATVKSAEEELKKDFSFRIDTRDRTFYFAANDSQEKESWIGSIGKAMVRPTVMRSQSEEEALNG